MDSEYDTGGAKAQAQAQVQAQTQYEQGRESEGSFESSTTGSIQKRRASYHRPGSIDATDPSIEQARAQAQAARSTQAVATHYSAAAGTVGIYGRCRGAVKVSELVGSI